jgi:hypothetical protein
MAEIQMQRFTTAHMMTEPETPCRLTFLFVGLQPKGSQLDFLGFRIATKAGPAYALRPSSGFA